MIAYEVPPPTCVGAKNIHAATSAAAARRAVATPVTRPLLMAASAGAPGEECSSPGGLRRTYEVAITDSWSAVVMAMSGLKSHVTLTPPAIEQSVYVVEPLTTFAFTVVALAFSVKVIESMLLGVVAFSWYGDARDRVAADRAAARARARGGTVFVAVKA